MAAVTEGTEVRLVLSPALPAGADVVNVRRRTDQAAGFALLAKGLAAELGGSFPFAPLPAIAAGRRARARVGAAGLRAGRAVRCGAAWHGGAGDGSRFSGAIVADGQGRRRKSAGALAIVACRLGALAGIVGRNEGRGAIGRHVEGLAGGEPLDGDGGK